MAPLLFPKVDADRAGTQGDSSTGGSASAGRLPINQIGERAGVITDHPTPRATSTQVANDSAFSDRFSPRRDGKKSGPKLLFIKINYRAHNAVGMGSARCVAPKQ